MYNQMSSASDSDAASAATAAFAGLLSNSHSSSVTAPSALFSGESMTAAPTASFGAATPSSSGGDIEELLPLVVQLTNPEQVNNVLYG